MEHIVICLESGVIKEIRRMPNLITARVVANGWLRCPWDDSEGFVTNPDCPDTLFKEDGNSRSTVIA